MSLVEGLYRLLGIVAPMNQRLWRHRVNFIPANVLLMCVLAVIAAGCGRTIAAVLESRRAPQRQPLSELLVSRKPARNYVALEGRLAPDGRIDFPQEGEVGNLELTGYAWTPLVDRATRKAILVQFPADRSFDSNGVRPVSSS